MYKVINVKDQSEEVVETKKAVAEFIAAADVTDNSVKTIQRKINDSVENDEVLYETFKIEEEDENMNEEVKNEEVATEGTNEEEVVYDNPEDLEVKNEDNETEVEQDETPESDNEEEELQEYLESEEAEQQVEQENEDAQRQLDEFKKSQEENKDDDKGDEKKDDDSEEKENRRRVGKGMIAYKNGEEVDRFPSIKACAEFMKEEKGLPHMPFTPIMKSARQGIDWDEWSFKHEKDEDLHIPESLKEKLSKESEEQNEPEAKDEEQVDEQNEDEVIEEIEEEELA